VTPAGLEDAAMFHGVVSFFGVYSECSKPAERSHAARTSASAAQDFVTRKQGQCSAAPQGMPAAAEAFFQKSGARKKFKT